FRKIVRFLSADSGRFLLVEKFPKPSDFPLITYNTAQCDFAEISREIFQKSLRFPVSLSTTDKVAKCQKRRKEKFTIQTFISIAAVLLLSLILSFSTLQGMHAFDGKSAEGSGKTAVEIDKQIATKYEGHFNRR
ncbi:MAG: hypothetical protein Q4F21_15515, partial [Lachnospiraceae bacterium]|nr:hypothetical protein [Lachnospiraceae bacterium]